MNQQTKPTTDAREEGGCWLLKLPDEVLLSICEYLCWHCQLAKPNTQVWERARHQVNDLIHTPTAALASLSRTCHRLSGIGNPILYHGFSAAEAAEMYNFLGTIQCRPELGRLVKAVFLHHVEIEDVDHSPGEYFQLICTSLLSFCVSQVEITNFHRLITSRKELGQYEALAGTIIASLRNIETLHLEIDANSRAFRIFDVLASCSRDILDLSGSILPMTKPANVLWPHLQDCTLLVGDFGTLGFDLLELEGTEYLFARCLTACEGLLSLTPRASRLHTRDFNGVKGPMGSLENITQLHLQSGNFKSTSTLEQAFRSIRSLQVFSFTWTYDHMDSIAEYFFEFGGITLEEVVENLGHHHKDTLKHLQLGFPAAYYDMDESTELPQLIQFTALEELKINGPSIPEIQEDDEEILEKTSFISLLPVSIRRLHIMFVAQSQVEHLLELTRDAQQSSTARRLPNLCEVTVMSYSPAEGASKSHKVDSILRSPGWHGLQSAFGQTDIAFSARTTDQIEWDICEF